MSTSIDALRAASYTVFKDKDNMFKVINGKTGIVTPFTVDSSSIAFAVSSLTSGGVVFITDDFSGGGRTIMSKVFIQSTSDRELNIYNKFVGSSGMGNYIQYEFDNTSGNLYSAGFVGFISTSNAAGAEYSNVVLWQKHSGSNFAIVKGDDTGALHLGGPNRFVGLGESGLTGVRMYTFPDQDGQFLAGTIVTSGATTGSGGSVPGAAAGWISTKVSGNAVKIPYFNT